MQPVQLIYWRLTWPLFLSLSLDTGELELWAGIYYARVLWRSPETGQRSPLWFARGRLGEQAKFNAVEAQKFAQVSHTSQQS